MNLFFFYLVTWRHLVAGACLGFLGYTFGATAAILTRMSRPQVIAVAIETAIQNGGIGVVVLNLTFPRCLLYLMSHHTKSLHCTMQKL